MKKVKYYQGYFWVENTQKVVFGIYINGYSKKSVANELRKEKNMWLSWNECVNAFGKGVKLRFRVKRKKWIVK